MTLYVFCQVGNTALLLACHGKELSLIQLLVTFGADLHARNLVSDPNFRLLVI